MKSLQIPGFARHVISSFALFASGCISVRETKYDDSPRLAVSFSSDHAARTFYETLQTYQGRAARSEWHSAVSLLLINVDQRTFEGPNRPFNDAVRFCDTNGDGQVTDFEADTFAREWPKFAAKD